MYTPVKNYVDNVKKQIDKKPRLLYLSELATAARKFHLVPKGSEAYRERSLYYSKVKKDLGVESCKHIKVLQQQTDFLNALIHGERFYPAPSPRNMTSFQQYKGAIVTSAKQKEELKYKTIGLAKKFVRDGNAYCRPTKARIERLRSMLVNYGVDKVTELKPTQMPTFYAELQRAHKCMPRYAQGGSIKFEGAFPKGSKREGAFPKGRSKLLEQYVEAQKRPGGVLSGDELKANWPVQVAVPGADVFIKGDDFTVFAQDPWVEDMKMMDLKYPIKNRPKVSKEILADMAKFLPQV